MELIECISVSSVGEASASLNKASLGRYHFTEKIRCCNSTPYP